MRIESFQPARLVSPGELGTGAPIGAAAPTPSSPPAPAPAAPEQAPAFGQVLSQELGRVNELLNQADVEAQRVATGDAQDLHESVLAMAEADLALQVTMRVTQKAIAAYQEISRMQI